MIVQACLNGGRAPGFHPRLPVTVDEIVTEGVAAVQAGAAELHVHIRDKDGRESLAHDHVAVTIAALRQNLPGTLIGISTGAWIENDDDRRLEAIAGWRVPPDHASVNLSEAGAPAVIESLHRRGVGVEAGVASVADAERLVRLGLGPFALRILVEMDAAALPDPMGETDRMLAVLARAGARKPILLHGFGQTVWPFVERAAREGFSTRVGLEDGAELPDGSIAALVEAAWAIMRRT